MGCNRYTDEVWGNLLPLVREAERRLRLLVMIHQVQALTSQSSPKARVNFGASTKILISGDFVVIILL